MNEFVKKQSLALLIYTSIVLPLWCSLWNCAPENFVLYKAVFHLLSFVAFLSVDFGAHVALLPCYAVVAVAASAAKLK